MRIKRATYDRRSFAALKPLNGIAKLPELVKRPSTAPRGLASWRLAELATVSS